MKSGFNTIDDEVVEFYLRKGRAERSEAMRRGFSAATGFVKNLFKTTAATAEAKCAQ